MPTYITRDVLKDRLLLKQVPLPEIDADLDEIIDTASGMVADRVDTTLYAADAPPARVKRATLILALRLRTAETLNATDADGNPMRYPLWTQDLTDILGTYILDTTPDTGTGLLPTAGVMTTTAPIPSPSGTLDANADAYTGSPHPAWTTRRIMP